MLTTACFLFFKSAVDFKSPVKKTWSNCIVFSSDGWDNCVVLSSLGMRVVLKTDRARQRALEISRTKTNMKLLLSARAHESQCGHWPQLAKLAMVP